MADTESSGTRPPEAAMITIVKARNLVRCIKYGNFHKVVMILLCLCVILTYSTTVYGSKGAFQHIVSHLIILQLYFLFIRMNK